MVIARSVRGMNDLFETELRLFRLMETSLHEISRRFAYQEIRTPILEDIALFKRGIGETSDIVEKEMFVVEDGEHTYCLRPENTAPVVRALIERGGISDDFQEKFYYFGPMFRKERPQKGRLRQFHQFGIEIFGVSSPIADIEIITMIHQFLAMLDVKGVSLKINSLGTNDERAAYKSSLRDFLQSIREKLCEDCQRRFDTNPLRVLDCKKENCRALAHAAPSIIDTLGDESRTHFDDVLRGLQKQHIAYEVDPHLVRGLDYYNRTVFEFIAQTGLGAQNTAIAGGRYDGLFHTLGSKIDLPAIGCAGGVERILMLLDENQKPDETTIAITLIGADDVGYEMATSLAFDLRKLGVAADFSLVKKSLKAQMRRADKSSAQFVVVLGEKESSSMRASIKNLATGQGVEVALVAEAIARFINTGIS